jgi:hypothetical protein
MDGAVTRILGAAEWRSGAVREGEVDAADSPRRPAMCVSDAIPRETIDPGTVLHSRVTSESAP